MGWREVWGCEAGELQGPPRRFELEGEMEDIAWVCGIQIASSTG